MTVLSLVLLLFLPSAAQQPEGKPVPKDSVEVAARGCLKGRVFTAIPREETDTVRGPDIAGRSFRLNAKGDAMKAVKAHNGDVVEVVGIIRTSALADSAPGRRIGNVRVVVGAPPLSNNPSDIHGSPISQGVPVMDVSSVRFVSEGCPIARR